MQEKLDTTWQEVNASSDRIHNFEADGEVLQGKYVRKQEDVGQNNSTLYTIEVDGENVGVWGNAVLNSRFELVPLGDLVKIEYQGYVKSEKTGREYKNYKVFRKPAPFEEVGLEDANTEAQVAADEAKKK